VITTFSTSLVCDKSWKVTSQAPSPLEQPFKVVLSVARFLEKEDPHGDVSSEQGIVIFFTRKQFAPHEETGGLPPPPGHLPQAIMISFIG